MGEITNLAQLIEIVEISRTDFENRIQKITEDDFSKNGVWGDWNIKDLLAHTVAWENEMIIWVDQVVNTQVIPVYLQPGFSEKDVDNLNMAIYQHNRERDLQEVLEEFFSNHQKVMGFIKKQNEEILFEPNRFNLRDDWPLWYVIGANTFWHYEEHLVDLDNLNKKED